MHAKDEVRSDQSGRRKVAKHRLWSLLGLSSLRQVLLLLGLEIAVAWLVLALAVAFVSNDPPMTTSWQRLQVLFSSRPTTLVMLLGVAAGVMVPSFVWIQVLFVWMRILPHELQASRPRRPADESQPRANPIVPAGPPE